MFHVFRKSGYQHASRARYVSCQEELEQELVGEEESENSSRNKGMGMDPVLHVRFPRTFRERRVAGDAFRTTCMNGPVFPERYFQTKTCRTYGVSEIWNLLESNMFPL